MGKVYEIAEPDLLEEIEGRKEKVVSFMKKEVSRMREEIENYSGEELEPAKKHRVFYVDPTYCLEQDIYYEDKGEWKVLYPKGYCFNPVDYIPYIPPSMVIFNPCREAEREYVKKLLEKGNYILIASGCSVKEVNSQGWEHPVYYLTSELKEKLLLKKTPSIVSVDRKKRAIKVEEVYVAGEGQRGASGKAEEPSN